MQASGLMDDATLESPNIIEIPLKDLGASVDLEQARGHPLAESDPVYNSHNNDMDDEDDEEEDKSDQCLLGEARKTQETVIRACSHSDLLRKLRELDSCSASSIDSPRHRSLSADAAASTPLLPPAPVPLLPPSSSSSSSSGSSSCRGARAIKPKTSRKHSACPSSPPIFASPTRVRFADSLPNGSLLLSRSPNSHRSPASDLDLDRAASDNLANDRLECGDQSGSLSKVFSNDSRYFASSVSSKFFDERDRNMVMSLLHKPRSYQDHLCCLDSSPQYPISLENMTKEELLFLWKTSELDLSRKLDEALKEKAMLEKKLALLQNQSPV